MTRDAYATLVLLGVLAALAANAALRCSDLGWTLLCAL